MNRNIYAYPRTLYARICDLAAQIRVSNAGLAFLVRYLALWSGPLGPVPAWLRASTRRFESQAPQAAIVLNAEYQLELLHHLSLAKDVGELRTKLELAAMLDSWAPNRAVERHMFLRTTVPPTDPMIIVAIGHEHATLDAVLCRALLHALRSQLPEGIDGRRFLRLRALDAADRARRTKLMLDRGRSQLGDCERTRAWMDTARDVVDSYLAAVESFAPAPSTAQRVVAPPSTGSSAPLM